MSHDQCVYLFVSAKHRYTSQDRLPPNIEPSLDRDAAIPGNLIYLFVGYYVTFPLSSTLCKSRSRSFPPICLHNYKLYKFEFLIFSVLLHSLRLLVILF